MKIQEKPPELDGSRCSACGNHRTASLARDSQPSPEATREFDELALALLESENSGLRKLVVELLEKNQRLRDQLHATVAGRNAESPTDLRLVGDRIAS
jgi:hypothetical protein